MVDNDPIQMPYLSGKILTFETVPSACPFQFGLSKIKLSSLPS